MTQPNSSCPSYWPFTLDRPSNLLVAGYVLATVAALDDPAVYWLGGGFLDCGGYRTDDGGKSWSRAFISDRPFVGGNMRIAVASSDPSRVYMSLGTGTAPGLYRSSDGGVSFEYLRINGLYRMGVDPKDATPSTSVPYTVVVCTSRLMAAARCSNCCPARSARSSFPSNRKPS